jgi:hypothetical protein
MHGINVYNSYLAFRHFAFVIYKYGILARSVLAICWQLLDCFAGQIGWQFPSTRMAGQDKPSGFVRSCFFA